MQWFYNWVLKRAEQKKQKSITMTSSPLRTEEVDHHYGTNTLNFTLTPATGGIIVSVKRYDEKRDRNQTTLHIINDDQDVATELGKIAVLELYKI